MIRTNPKQRKRYSLLIGQRFITAFLDNQTNKYLLILRILLKIKNLSVCLHVHYLIQYSRKLLEILYCTSKLYESIIDKLMYLKR